MKHIKLFEQFIPKLNDEPITVSSIGVFGQRITNTGKKKIRKQDMIVATDKTIKQIVRDEIKRLGNDADLNHIDVNQVTDMDYLFHGIDFQGDVSQWDVRKVERMYRMFEGCTNFNCDLSEWIVSSVKDMSYMFKTCFNFNQDISNWDVSKVESMYAMFDGCSNFNQDLSKWNVEKVEEIAYIFYGCPIKKEYKPKFNI